MRLVRPTRVAARAIAATALAAALVGCGPSGPATGDVSGKVTFKGKTVTEGSVTFLNPTEGGTAGADIGPDGSYTIKKVVVGDYIVIITPPIHIVDTDPGKSPPAPVEKPAPNIPQKYRQQGMTPFKHTVKEGKNEINLDMQ